jgi:phasin family protein
MAKTAENPFMFDVTKFMPDFDPAKMMDDFTKATGQFKVPGLDMDGLMAAQKKNLDALTVANKKAVDGVQALTKRQAEIMQASLDAATKGADEIAKSASPQEAAAKQTELYKAALESGLTNMRELADLMTKSNADVAETINTRVSESLDELKAQIVKLKT